MTRTVERSPGRTVWVNCAAGVAGDMLLAALIDAGADRMAVLEAWAQLDLDGFAATWERVDRSGISALWTNLVIDHTGNDHTGSEHQHADAHDTHHVHRRARDVIAMLTGSALPDRVRSNAIAVYRMLAHTEAAIHGQVPDDVELHEVGAVDSILDIVGVCAAVDDLDVDDLSYSVIGLGAGSVATAHGALPHPAPATARLLTEHGAPVTGLDTTLETATPTGVALLTTLGIVAPSPPPMEITAVGYGAGRANPVGRANVVQVFVGYRSNDSSAADSDPERLVLIETNIDDVTGETIAYTIERLIDSGALDAWATPITMKKNRPATSIQVLARPDQLATLRAVLTDETGSLGVRVRYVDRYAHDRREDAVEVDGHPIRIKVAGHRFKVEFEDAAAVARATGRPLRAVTADAEFLYRSRLQSAERPVADESPDPAVTQT